MDMEHSSGTIGGVLGVIFGNIIGIITFGGLIQTIVYAGIGAIVGYFTVKLIKFLEKKCKSNVNN